MRKTVLALCLVGFALHGVDALAQAGFSGTWRLNLDKTRPSATPVKLEFTDGIYRCHSCGGADFSVVADGRDHPDSSDPAFDTSSARLSADGVLHVVRKRAGVVRREFTITPSPDGERLVLEFLNYRRAGDEPGRITTRMTRHGRAVSGLHPINGEWLVERWDSGPGNDTTVTVEVNGDKIKVETPAGGGYEATLDGREYPVKGSDHIASVRVKLIGETAIEETNLRAGKVDNVQLLTLSPDGRTVTVVRTSDGRTDTFVWEKQ